MVTKVCSECGSVDVVCDAWVEWDSEKKEWVIQNIFDYEYCLVCDGETTIKDAP